MVGVWEGLNLGSIPNDHMPSQKDPKISIERRCSTILPHLFLIVTICYCYSQCNFNCFLLFNCESQSFLGFFLSLTDIRHQVDNILFHPECMRCQICKEVDSFEDSSVSTPYCVTCRSRFFKYF